MMGIDRELLMVALDLCPHGRGQASLLPYSPHPISCAGYTNNKEKTNPLLAVKQRVRE
jgi:hypothetical protein